MLLNILSNVAEVMVEVATSLFSNENNSYEENETYKYWSELSYDEQKEYFESNEYLKGYMDNHYYKNDRNLTAKHVAELAEKLNREFTNKYSRY